MEQVKADISYWLADLEFFMEKPPSIPFSIGNRVAFNEYADPVFLQKPKLQPVGSTRWSLSRRFGLLCYTRTRT